MKLSVIVTLCAIVIFSCKKEPVSPLKETKKENYFIRVAGSDGSSIDYSTVAIVKAVNGGQQSENAFSKAEYIGYSNGFYILKISNKQECGIDFTITWPIGDTSVYISGGIIRTIQLPGAYAGNEKIKVKPLYRCGSSGGDLGQLELITPASLPIKFKYITAHDDGNGKIRVAFEVSEASGMDKYFIEISKDGKHYITAAKIDAEKVTPNIRHSLVIQL